MTMPKIQIDWRPNIISLINTALMIIGFLVGVAIFYSDVRRDSARLSSLAGEVKILQQADQSIVGKITDAQQSTANRLTTLETQNVFILRSLDRLETTIRERKL